MFYNYKDHVDRDWKRYVVYVKRFKKNPKKIFDMGCGLGHFMRASISCDMIAIGCDFSQEAVDSCKDIGLNVFKQNLYNKISNIEDETFDAVNNNQVIEHLQLDGQINMINEAYRILKVGGEFLINSPCKHYKPATKDPYHVRLLTPSELKKMLLDAGFHNINLGYNRPRKVWWIPNVITKSIWKKYKPDFLSQTAAAYAVKK